MKKNQELDEKEKKLLNKNIKINDLKKQNELLKKGSDDLKDIIDSKNTENDKLRDEFTKLKKVKIDNKARTFDLPKHDEESDRSKKLLEEYMDTIEERKYIFDPKGEIEKINPE